MTFTERCSITHIITRKSTWKGNSLNNALTQIDIECIAAKRFDYESVGVFSDRPYVCVDLNRITIDEGAIIDPLPCPVIGIGHGPLAAYCDVICEDEPIGIGKNIENAPMAATALVQLLRLSDHLQPQDMLLAESFAYGTVQRGAEFQSWHASKNLKPENSNPETSNPKTSKPGPAPLEVMREGGTLLITLNNPEHGNEIDVPMRDALCEALDIALADPAINSLELLANGRIFSTGGAVSEFGTIGDPLTAHMIRNQRLPAARLIQLSNRLSARIEGPAIGAGIEMAAFAKHIRATPKAWFQLPELKYGLIAGAGGTASIPKRIGRQRTAYMALSMKRINAQTALDWGLIDEIIS